MALAALCTACSSIGDPLGYAVVTQDKFDFMTCREILAQRGNLINQEKRLAESAAKAEAAPGGIIVSYTAYRSELLETRNKLAAADRGLRKNGCEVPK